MPSVSQKIGFGVWGACAVLGPFAGALVGPNVETDQIANYEQRIEQADEHALELDLDREEVILELGESCFALLRQYEPGEELAGTSETDIVGDLLQWPSQPCGTTAVEARGNVRSLFHANQEIHDTAVRKTNLEEAKTEVEALANDSLPEDFGDMLGGLGAGIGVGVVAALVASSIAGRIRDEETIGDVVCDVILL